MLSTSNGLKGFALFAICSSVLTAQVPSGWGLAGSKPSDYECSLDPTTTYQDQKSVYLKSKPGAEGNGFGTMSQYFDAAQFAGKRVRFSANMKALNIDPHGSEVSWAGLWMRVDDARQGKGDNPKVVAFDNMHQVGVDRALKGTRPWQNYSVILDVPEGATGIGLGVLLAGTGAVWTSGIKVEVVGPEVPVSADNAPRQPKEAPTNLSFEK